MKGVASLVLRSFVTGCETTSYGYTAPKNACVVNYILDLTPSFVNNICSLLHKRYKDNDA